MTEEMKKKYKVRDKGEQSERTQKELINACTPMGLVEQSEETQNAYAVSVVMALRSLPPIDIENAAEVEQRTNEYFAFCCQQNLKPTPSSYALALGLSRQAVTMIKSGRKRVPRAVYEVIEKGSVMMDALMEMYMLEGKVNVVSGIFLMKNNNNYSDKVEALTGSEMDNAEKTSAEIRDKYKNLVD